MTITAADTRKGRFRHPPFAEPGAAVDYNAGAAEAIPPILDFLDDLPSIDDFLFANHVSSQELPSIDFYLEDSGNGTPAEATSSEAVEYDEEGWAVAGWQSFNWAAAASLGAADEGLHHADAAWSMVDWSETVAPQASAAPAKPRAEVPPTADEVARALDGIARRIRSGELVIDQLSGAPPEAAMAAALAALLRMRG